MLPAHLLLLLLLLHLFPRFFLPSNFFSTLFFNAKKSRTAKRPEADSRGAHAPFTFIIAELVSATVLRMLTRNSSLEGI